MLLSGILILLAITIISTLFSVSVLQNKSSNQNNNLINIHNILKESFFNSSRIERGQGGNLTFYYSNKEPLNIAFHPNSIILSSYNLQDTISVNWENLRIFKVRSDSSLVERVSFVAFYNNLFYPISITKDYSNQCLFHKPK